MPDVEINIEVRDHLGNLIEIGDHVLAMFPSSTSLEMREGRVTGFYRRQSDYSGDTDLMEVEWVNVVASWRLPDKPTKLEVVKKRFIKFPGWADGYPKRDRV